MKRISAAAVLLIVVSLSAPEAVRAQRTGSFLYHYVDPPVIYFDGSTATRVEVATTGQSIRQVLLTYPELGAMYDDGSHGDRIAGDGIYTLSGVTMRGAAGTMPYYGGTHGAAGFRVKIIKTDGTEQEVTAVTYALVSAGQNFPTLQLADGLYATGSAFFVVDPKGEALDSVIPLGSVRCGRGAYAAFHKLYSVFPDVFDFVVVMPSGSILDPARDYGENTPYFVRAKNEIRNIGVPLFDRTAEFGSQGRLRGMIYHSFGEGAILDHEIGHSWMASFGKRFELSECAQCYGDHWNPYTDIGGQMGAFLLNVPGVAAGHLVANGDGTFRVQQVDQSAQGYSKLDLYLMGLIPSSEVPLVNKLVNPDFSNPQRVTAQRVETYTIQQLVQAEGGERVPAFPTQKDFNLAFVAVKNKAFTPAEFAYFSLVARYFASRERGERYFVPFNAATGGRGALN
ncbi:MAG: hypothetical protein FJW34_00725, partial [Acidobacteria bacterium]|nr:hypothetical protein [Acidobacteriota bacterium]